MNDIQIFGVVTIFKYLYIFAILIKYHNPRFV